jgi:tRNA(Arg) A34 adenosine deaminase TadA
MIYQDLSKEWRMCFHLAVDAFRHNSLPIGCIVFDETGKPISKAHAKMIYASPKSNMVQHAEIEALTKVLLPQLEQKLTLYTTVEPCPMCFGAMNVARIAELHYGTRDPWAGSTNLLDGNWYMKRKHIDILPAQKEFERIMAIFVVYAMMRKPKNQGFFPLKNEFVERWQLFIPEIKQILTTLIEIHLESKKNPIAIFNVLKDF